MLRQEQADSPEDNLPPSRASLSYQPARSSQKTKYSTSEKLSPMRSLLILVAHPDDESFFAAGTMAKYAEDGVRMAIVCGTRGERGATSNLCSVEELPRVREAELREAARLLGVDDVELLPYEDQKLGAAPAEAVRRHIVQAIRR